MNQPSDSDALALARHAAASWIQEALTQHFTLARATALASERTWGGKTYSASTLEGWYYLWRHQGFEALHRRPRKDKGSRKALSPEACQALLEWRQKYPQLTIKVLVRQLTEQGTLQAGTFSLPSVYRFLAAIRQGWQQLDRLWPIVVIDQAQNLSAPALEEVRLLSCDRRDTQPPFSLLLVGDEQLLPRLQMGINAPLLARLSFCLRLEPWTADQLSDYVQARLEQVGIHANPFEAPALVLLLRAGNGLPRLLNHLAQRALEEAAAQNSRTVTAAHVQRALELLPWVAQLPQ